MRIQLGILMLSSIILAHPIQAKDKEASQTMEKLVFALKVTDEKMYQTYRNAIAPIMARLNIQVIKEYNIAEVLHSDHQQDQVSRLAVFGFPTNNSKLVFFNDPDYLKAKSLFNASTANFIKIIE